MVLVRIALDHNIYGCHPCQRLCQESRLLSRVVTPASILFSNHYLTLFHSNYRYPYDIDMLYIVTLSLRTISVMERSSNRRSLTNAKNNTQYGIPPFPQKFNEALVHSLFHGLTKPVP